jgi:hypothetical protein
MEMEKDMDPKRRRRRTEERRRETDSRRNPTGEPHSEGRVLSLPRPRFGQATGKRRRGEGDV